MNTANYEIRTEAVLFCLQQRFRIKTAYSLFVDNVEFIDSVKIPLVNYHIRSSHNWIITL
jgi:hypothetical protein